MIGFTEVPALALSSLSEVPGSYRPPRLVAVNEQPGLGREWRDAADYWTCRVEPGPALHDARTIPGCPRTYPTRPRPSRNLLGRAGHRLDPAAVTGRCSTARACAMRARSKAASHLPGNIARAGRPSPTRRSG